MIGGNGSISPGNYLETISKAARRAPLAASVGRGVPDPKAWCFFADIPKARLVLSECCRLKDWLNIYT
jgi:hypothetical protein